MAGKDGTTAVVGVRIAGGNAKASAEGVDVRQSRTNYITGSDPENWRTNVENYGSVRYREIYRGIDLVYHGTTGELEYDFIVRPHADPRTIDMRISGASARIDGNGDLVLRTPAGAELRQRRPVVYQQTASRRITRDGRFVLRGRDRVGFQIGEYDRSRELVIDPVLSFSTYLGGVGTDTTRGIAVDSFGYVYVTGTTTSIDLAGNGQGARSSVDAFVAKLNPEGSTLIYTSYIGGASTDNPAGIAVDSGSNVYVAGTTSSTDFPNVAGSYRNSSTGAFIFKLSNAGTLTYSALIAINTDPSGIAVDSFGNAFVTGTTSSSTFPTTSGALRTSLGGYSDAFVLALNNAGSGLVFSTYLGGASGETGRAVALDSLRDVTVVGTTGSSDFPTTAGAGQRTWKGTYYEDAFITRLSASGALVYSTFLGGSDSDTAVAVANQGRNAIVTGYTRSSDLPVTAAAFQTQPGSAFIAKIGENGDFVTVSYFSDFSYYYSAPPSTVAVSSSGNVYVGGTTSSAYLPITTGALQTLPAGDSDAFVLQFDPGLELILYGTYLGGFAGEQLSGIAVAGETVYLTGTTNSVNFPTLAGGHKTTAPSGSNSFVAKMQDSVCSYTLSSNSGSFASPAGTGTFTVTAPAGCSWIASARDNWITVTSALTGSGTSTVSYSVALNNSTYARTGTITIGGLTFLVEQAGACIYTVVPTARSFPAAGGISTATVTTPSGCSWTASSPLSWITVSMTDYYGQRVTSISGNGAVRYTVAPNSGALRTGSVNVAGQTVTVTQSASGSSGCTYSVSPATKSYDHNASSDSVSITSGAGCSWTASANVSWITFTNSQGSGNGSATYSVAANTTGSGRSGTITAAGRTVSVTQTAAPANPPPVINIVNPTTATTWSTTSNVITLAGNASDANGIAQVTWASDRNGSGVAVGTTLWAVSDVILQPGVNNFTVTARDSLGATTTDMIAITYQTASEAIGPLQFVPLSACRVADTRNAIGVFGGPAIAANSSRDFPLRSSTCGIPATAQAYSLSITVLPKNGYLGYLTVWPSGRTRPLASTLNSWDGRSKAAAVIVPAGTNGAVSVFATDLTDVVIEVNGYFVGAGTAGALSFYPLTPCRVVDTRGATGHFGGPSMPANSSRSFSVLSSTCGVPANAAAYSLNLTAVPGAAGLGTLTAWPSGSPQPGVSYLTAPAGKVTANAAIVAAGVSGAIMVHVSQQTDVVIDINGYFAPPGGPGALSLYATPPCRVMDTRESVHAPAVNGERQLTVGGFCDVPSTAAAVVLNATALPVKVLWYLSLWPANLQQPGVSTTNSWDGSIISNSAIVPMGSGAIKMYATETSHVILDVTGYFAP
jgi:hypothetical protein